MEGIALSALLGALIAGTGAYVAWGREVMTKKDHSNLCKLIQAPVEQRFDSLQASQERTGKKVDVVSGKVDRVLGALQKMDGGNG